MQIRLENIGKRYHFEWIFKAVNLEFHAGQGYALTGNNGSGKSTLMQLLSGHLSPSKGQIHYSINREKIEVESVYKHLSYAAPYIEMLEEFTLLEAVDFHCQFKKLLLDKKAFIKRLDLPKSALKKEIKYFSSGMQQRLKLGLAICSDTSLLLLDEPTITLDQNAVNWYQDLLQEFGYNQNRLTIIASNVAEDFIGCQTQISVLDYKK